MTVTLNPALDVTYRVDALRPGQEHRVAQVEERAGGKGVNVARVLAEWGRPVRATGLLGGSAGLHIAAELTTVDSQFMAIAGASRRTVVVVDERGATGFWEPGPVVTPAEWRSFLDRFPGLLDGVSVVVLAGSLPPGVPGTAYAELTALAHQAGTRVVVDADGAALVESLPAGPDVVKPNRTELAAATGRVITDPVDALAAARELRHDARTSVVATLGADGLAASTVDGDWLVTVGVTLAGNPTGAGDACVAALADGLDRDLPWPDRLAQAAAVSVAAVRAPVAGTVDPAEVSRWRRDVIVAAA